MTDYLQRAPFVRVLLPFVAGIVVSTLEPPLPAAGLLAAAISAWLLAAVCLHAGRYRHTLPGILFTLFFFFSGLYLTERKDSPPAEIMSGSYRAVLLERPVGKGRSWRSEALITRVFSGDSLYRVRERILVYFSATSRADTLLPGNCILFSRHPVAIENRGNPFEFDYKGYLLKKSIRYRLYLDEHSWVVGGEDKGFMLLVLAEKTRDRLLDIYRRNGLEGDAFDVLSALTLGYKKSLDPETRQLFSSTGAAHVLAVSGLHVGIVYMVFSLLFGFLRTRRSTRILYVAAALLLLWCFAFITGMSPSVRRSALMFTVVLAGENLRRPANIYNTLALSAFILLVSDPNLLYDAGMELSFAAVAGIVFFQPRLRTLFQFRNKAANWLWDLFTVSLAAQLTTFPLSSYYFNQFPLYFWLSNFIVIPAALVFIVLGMLILATAPAVQLSGFLTAMAGLLVKGLLRVLECIGDLPGSLLSGFSFPASSLFLSFALILLTAWFMATRKPVFLMASFLAASLLFLTGAVRRAGRNLRSEIIAYHCDDPVVHLISGRDNYLLAPEAVLHNNFPEWEVRSVTTTYGLRKPVPLPFESDFQDGEVVKKGNFIFFKGRVIALQQEEELDCGFVVPDLIIYCRKSAKNARFPAAAQVAAYAPEDPRQKAAPAYHSIPARGAWSCRLENTSAK